MTPFAILIKAVTLWSSGEGCMSWTLSVLLLLQQRPLAAKRHLARIHMAFKTICHKFLIAETEFSSAIALKSFDEHFVKKTGKLMMEELFCRWCFLVSKTTKTSLKTVTHVLLSNITKMFPHFLGGSGTNATNFAMLKNRFIRNILKHHNWVH